MTFLFTNELYLSRFMKNNFIGHRIDIKLTSNLKLIENAVMSFNSATVKMGHISG